MSRQSKKNQQLSRRTLLKGLGLAPILLRPAPFYGAWIPSPGESHPFLAQEPVFDYADIRFTPHYPSNSPLEDILRLVTPGSDEYLSEQYTAEIKLLIDNWGSALRASAHHHQPLLQLLNASFKSSSLQPIQEVPLRSGFGIDAVRRLFTPSLASGREHFPQELEAWLGPIAHIETAEFEITAIHQTANSPLTVELSVRYDLVAVRSDQRREERVGTWLTTWTRDPANQWTALTWQASEETISLAQAPAFVDITAQSLGSNPSYAGQILRGVDYWRTVLDGASGIDVYGNNGIAAGDYDNDGFDDIYVCQPAGLPNRLYRNRGDGTFEDVTDKAGVGVLDGTACALFADLENRGLQDLLVVCASGPLLFLNQGNGTFAIKRDAFKFAQPPQGSFTHAALADYDRDGRLDIYFCTYSYYLGLDQYHYPVPYYDARNGPANFLFHNEGNSTFVDKTEAAGLNAENDRYSFACAWGHAGASGYPDLYVANDFGRNTLYRNNGNGTFTAISDQAHINDAGAGMSACWADVDNDGKQDIYVANMWSAAGQRVSTQPNFHPGSKENIRAFYQRHAMGNSLYQNQAHDVFQNTSHRAGVAMGRWAWSSDFWDFDHDGYADLYVTNGYISALKEGDLASFFWRQVVAKSPDDATPTQSYEHGWQALNELIRSDSSWNGYERNVMFANNRDATFTEISGPVGLDFPEDGRSFALADLNHDGRLEVILKNRNAPQVRILQNNMAEIGQSICFRLHGKQSNRDAIGAAITLETGELRQTKYLQAGSGFLAQHSKELFFGIGKAAETIKATIQWPSGLSQQLPNLPANHRIEVEEGSASFAARPFTAVADAHPRTDPKPSLEPLPKQIDTWLLQPLKAPAFTLPDLAGTQQPLQQFRGNPLLLIFWSAASVTSRDQLTLLQGKRSTLSGAHLQLVAINIDQPSELAKAKSFVTERKLGFPSLFATEEVAGTYNIIYRYLFDRRRNLGIPTSFLLNKDGMIVKVYQGPLDVRLLAEDARTIPATPEERIRKALPFAGTLYQESFQRNEFTYGVAMFQHGYLDQAAESFQQVIAAKPDDPEAYYNLGTLNLRRNDFPQARHYLEQTLKLRPNYPEAWNNLGMMAAQQGHAAEAVQDFQQSLLLRPGYAIALLNLGNVYRRQGAFDKAQDCLDQALVLQPDDPETNYSVGMFYAQQSHVQQAAEYLQKAIDLRPTYAEAINNLGVLYVREQQYAQAEAEFRNCIRLVPAFDQSYINLARLFALQHDKEKARAALQELLTIQPENAHAKQAMEMLNSTP